MAVSVKAVSANWTVSAITPQTTTLVGTPAAGDRYFMFSSWKDFSVTASISTDGGWTEITEFADGSVSSGANVGSVKVAAWWRDWQSGDSNPQIDYSAAISISSRCMFLLQKGASDSWDSPLFATAAWPSSSSQTVSASSTTAVPSGGIVLAMIGIRDDSATFTRGATTGIDVSSGITWTGDYVEDIAAHATTTTNDDMSADIGSRQVTTGGTVTLRATATLSAAETGSILWIAQGATAPASAFAPPFSKRHRSRIIR